MKNKTLQVDSFCKTDDTYAQFFEGHKSKTDSKTLHKTITTLEPDMAINCLDGIEKQDYLPLLKGKKSKEQRQKYWSKTTFLLLTLTILIIYLYHFY